MSNSSKREIIKHERGRISAVYSCAPFWHYSLSSYSCGWRMEETKWKQIQRISEGRVNGAEPLQNQRANQHAPAGVLRGPKQTPSSLRMPPIASHALLLFIV